MYLNGVLHIVLKSNIYCGCFPVSILSYISSIDDAFHRPWTHTYIYVHDLNLNFLEYVAPWTFECQKMPFESRKKGRALFGQWTPRSQQWQLHNNCIYNLSIHLATYLSIHLSTYLPYCNCMALSLKKLFAYGCFPFERLNHQTHI